MVYKLQMSKCFRSSFNNVNRSSTVPGLKTPVDVTGISIYNNFRNIQYISSNNCRICNWSISNTLSLGQAAEIPGSNCNSSGFSINSSIGSVTITGAAIVDVSGIGLTASVGQLMLLHGLRLILV